MISCSSNQKTKLIRRMDQKPLVPGLPFISHFVTQIFFYSTNRKLSSDSTCHLDILYWRKVKDDKILHFFWQEISFGRKIIEKLYLTAQVSWIFCIEGKSKMTKYCYKKPSGCTRPGADSWKYKFQIVYLKIPVQSSPEGKPYSMYYSLLLELDYQVSPVCGPRWILSMAANYLGCSK